MEAGLSRTAAPKGCHRLEEKDGRNQGGRSRHPGYLALIGGRPAVPFGDFRRNSALRTLFGRRKSPSTTADRLVQADLSPRTTGLDVDWKEAEGRVQPQ